MHDTAKMRYITASKMKIFTPRQFVVSFSLLPRDKVVVPTLFSLMGPFDDLAESCGPL